MNWSSYFFKICDTVSLKSKDPSTKVGSVIVGPSLEIRSTGFNGFPRGVNDDEERYLNKPLKYQLVVHAEMNAILSAARNGASLADCVLYTHWLPCHECAKAIIQSGISKVVISDKFMKKRGEKGWEESFKLTKMMFEEAEIEITFYREKEETEEKNGHSSNQS